MKLHREGYSILLSEIIISLGIIAGLSFLGLPDILLYIASGIAVVVFIF